MAGCSGCSKRKIIRANSPKAQIVQSQFSAENFMAVYYVGTPGQVVGVATQIIYGLRTYNQQMLVHINDYNDASNANKELFSLTEVTDE